VNSQIEGLRRTWEGVFREIRQKTKRGSPKGGGVRVDGQKRVWGFQSKTKGAGCGHGPDLSRSIEHP